MGFTDWWMNARPVTLDSTITSSQLGDDSVTVDAVGSNLWAFIPGEASIVLSSKSSNNEWYVSVQLRDADGEPFLKVMPLRVYLGSTVAAGSAVSSTSFTAFAVASSATSSGGGPSLDLAGVATSTHLANVDLSFLTNAAGQLTLSAILTTDAATTDAMHVVWAGGTYHSSDTIGSTTVTT